MHHSDVTLQQLRIPMQCRAALKQLLSLTEGSDIVIQPADWDSFISLSAVLENSELGSLVFESMGPNIIIENVSGRVHLKFNANWESKPKLNFLLGILSVVRWILISVDFDILCQILSHPLLIVLSDDHLCKFVLSRIERDESQVQLLEFVRFEFISSELLSKVLS
jgi:hypothetical protein